MRPVMGRPQLGHLLDAVLTLVPEGIIVFTHAADEKTAAEVRALMPHGGSVVADSGDAGAFIDRMLAHLRGHPGDILFVSATAAPLTAEFLRDLIDDYRRNPNIPCALSCDAKGGGRTTRLFIADASAIGGIGALGGIKGQSGDRGGPFADRVFKLLDSGKARDYAGDRCCLPGDITVPQDFAAAARAVRGAVAERLMDAGVTIIDPERTYVDWGVAVGSGTTLSPDTYLEGATTVGAGCVIEPSVKITNSEIGDGVTVKMCSVITESVVESGVRIGPFAHIRPKTRLCRDVKIGNFVEVKKSTIGKGSKASHLSYLGDAQIGKDVNVGAGTITCNYDGIDKHVTTIGDGVFIGSDTQFIAPVSVGDNALIGAGSTITKDIPPDSLAVARSKQVTIPGKGVKSRKQHT
jgi:bifunctional N-acetylglucosamine-1-phosphate-uridyltransferase/glucosamine-1-phosphate-acetyltransferase GlmU-like protein